MAATTSQVKGGIADITTIIRTEGQAFANAKARIQAASANLNAIGTQFADVIAQIDLYPHDGSAFEQLMKDERARLTAEFSALKGQIDTLIASF